jgi:hypothetical protein
MSTNGCGIAILSDRIQANTVTEKRRSRLLPKANTWHRKKRWTMKSGGRTIQQIGHPPLRKIIKLSDKVLTFTTKGLLIHCYGKLAFACLFLYFYS